MHGHGTVCRAVKRVADIEDLYRCKGFVAAQSGYVGIMAWNLWGKFRP